MKKTADTESKNSIIILNILERLVILKRLFPATYQGNILQVRGALGIIRKVDLSSNERDLLIKNRLMTTTGAFVGSIKRADDLVPPVSYEFDNAERGMLRERLKEMSEKRELNLGHIGLYEKFVEDRQD